MARTQTRTKKTRGPKTLPVRTTTSKDAPRFGPPSTSGERRRHEPPTTDEPVVIEGEVVVVQEDVPTPAPETESQAAAADHEDTASESRDELRGRTRESFGARRQKRAAQKARADERLRAMAEAQTSQSAERDQLHQLRAEVWWAGEKYRQSLRESEIFVKGFTPAKVEKKTSAMQGVYTQMMVQGCMRPLRQGMSPATLVQSLGTATTMLLLDKQFRSEVGKAVEPVGRFIRERVDARTRSVRDRAQGEADAYNETGGFRSRREGDPERSRDDYLSKRWRKRLERYEHRERGHREVFTTESAALTQMGLMENAFYAMRDPSMDSAEIHENYRALRRHLRQQVIDDGLDMAEVNKRTRALIGERMEVEPELQVMFNGMAHGRMVKSDPHPVRLPGDTKDRQVWTGEFEDHLGAPIPDEGVFVVRRPLQRHEHRQQMAEVMEEAMLSGLERNDPRAYSASVMGYMVGFAGCKQGLDTSGVDPLLRQRIEATEVMIGSMSMDGLDEEDQRSAYSHAFSDAMEKVSQKHPGVNRRLQQCFGENWQEVLQDAVTDPQGFLREQSEGGGRGFTAGADHSEKTERRPDFSEDWGYSERERTADYQPQ